MDAAAPPLPLSFPCTGSRKNNSSVRFHRNGVKSVGKGVVRALNASVGEGGDEAAAVEMKQRGGKMVAQLVGAYNQLTHSLPSSSLLLFNALKLAIPILHSMPPTKDRSPLSKALSVALILADLEMDADLISAAILIQVVQGGAMTLPQVRDRIGPATAHLLHETLRLQSNIFSKLHLLLPPAHTGDGDGDSAAAALRKFCLTFYDPRALLLHLAVKLDTMRHLHHLPRHQQHLVSLEVINVHAPLAHALDTRFLSLQLDDLSFRYLFPNSYPRLDSWLRTHPNSLLHAYRDRLLQSLTSDPLLMGMVAHVSVKARHKTRFSTMKKLLRDGRRPQDVNDIFGLRVVLTPLASSSHHIGDAACYRAREIIQSMWTEIPSRCKDYIAAPKANGYRSLHMALHIPDRPPMEVQIRTLHMDALAADGTASHALYKSGLTDPQEAKRLKAIMIATLELAAVRVPDLPSAKTDQVFCLLDKNNDGKISIDELTQVMEELGAAGEDAHEMMLLLDSNSDGSLSSEEFDQFQNQVELLNDKDDQFKTLLDEKLQISDTSGYAEQ